MSNCSISRVRFGTFTFAVFTCLALMASRAQAQGNYGPVTEKDVVAMELNHYFTPDKKGCDRDFEWTFTENEFVLKKGQGPIPADLLQRLLPKDMQADEIRGQWKLDDQDGRRLVLTKIKVGDENDEAMRAGRDEAVFPIYRTAPTVIRVGEPQYVFGLDWRNH